MSNSQGDQYKEKFRRDSDPALDKEVEAALGDVSVEQLLGYDKPQEQQQPGQTSAQQTDGTRHGKVVSIGRDDVFVDLGGKSQGICSIMQFETVKIGDEFDFVVDHYDEREGLLVLNRKGIIATNVSWENLEVGQVIEGTVTGMNKGGLELDIKGMREFMPSGQVDL
jgi:ribosomal protein S1